MFFSSIHFAIVNSNYWNTNLKPKQVKCLEAIYLGRDTIGVLPTGYGKLIIFHLLPGLFFDKINSKSAQSASSSSSINPVVVVVSPLNSLISDQIRRKHWRGRFRAWFKRVKFVATKGSKIQPGIYTPRSCFIVSTGNWAFSERALSTICSSTSCWRSSLYSRMVSLSNLSCAIIIAQATC